MNAPLISLEISVVVLGLALLLAEFLVPAGRRKYLGYAAIAGLGALLLATFNCSGICPPFGTAFGGVFINDEFSLFFKRLFIVAAMLVTFIAVEFSDRFAPGNITEYFSLTLFALAGMLFAASANDFVTLFVAIELITVTFYVLVSYQRNKTSSLEAGVKYLILGALSSAFMVYGIALVWGVTGKLDFVSLSALAPQFADNKMFLLGVLFIMAGLGFKITAFPFQIWAPDVYQGAPTPTTAFLAIGSKAAGFVLLLRVLFSAVPDLTQQSATLLMIISGLTLLYGNLCALPQRNIKRLLGYSSIAHAGYLLLGIAALNVNGSAAILYYLMGYLFTVLAGFLVIAIVLRHLDAEDVAALAGLSRRSPLLAATLTISMASLAGIPPLAGFFGKFLLLKSVVEAAQTTGHHGYYCLVFVALAGIVMSFYYYFGVVRAIYWGKETSEQPAIELSPAAKAAAWICLAGIFGLGLFPSPVLTLATQAAALLHVP